MSRDLSFRIGRWKWEESGVVYDGREGAIRKHGIAVLRQRLRHGSAAVTIELSSTRGSSAGLIVGYSGEDEGYAIGELGGHGAAYGISSHQRPIVNIGAWSPIRKWGETRSLDANRKYRLVPPGRKLDRDRWEA